MATNTNKVVLGFVFLLIGVILAGVIPSVGQDTYTKTQIGDEAIDISSARDGVGDINVSVTFTIDNAPTSYKTEDCPITSVTYGNASTDYTLTTDYTIADSTGVLTLVNSTAVIAGGNDTVIDYTYCGDNYLTVAWGRTMIQLTMGFFALGVFGIGLWILYGIWKESGLM